MNDAQRELCEKLDAPLHTADDCMVMAEAANEIRYLAARVDALERDAARRTTPDREAIIEECAKVMESRAEEIEAGGSHIAGTMGRIYRDEAMNIRKLKTAPTSDQEEKS